MNKDLGWNLIKVGCLAGLIGGYDVAIALTTGQKPLPGLNGWDWVGLALWVAGLLLVVMLPKAPPKPRRKPSDPAQMDAANAPRIEETVDYAKRAVRDNPDMQKWFEDQFQVPWEDGRAQTKLVFALGFAAALLHQRGEKPGPIEE